MAERKYNGTNDTENTGKKSAAARFYETILAPACCFFALIVFAVTLIGVSINSGKALSPRALIGFFVFSLRDGAYHAYVDEKPDPPQDLIEARRTIAPTEDYVLPFSVYMED